MSAPAPSVWDPFASGYTDDPYPQLTELRESGGPVAHPLGFYAVWRYDDVVALLQADLSVDEQQLAADSVMRGLVPDDPDSAPRGGLSMLDRDPPDHTRLRRLVSKAFTARAVTALEPMIRGQVTEAIDRLRAAGAPDVVRDVAFPVPFAVISTMLGMPPADADRVRELSSLLVRSLEPLPDADLADRIVAADEEMSALVQDAIAWKRRQPADDLLTALINARDDGDELSDDELVAQVVLLYVAGHETTVSLIGGGTANLLANPDQLRALRADPALIPNAVEELLRFDSPVQMTRRMTTRDWEVAGEVVPRGSFVIGHLAAANRDPRHFGPDADALRVDRATAREHLSFSTGVHHCLGSALARLEARVAFEELLRRCPNLELSGPVVFNGRINLRGPDAVPVTV